MITGTFSSSSGTGVSVRSAITGSVRRGMVRVLLFSSRRSPVGADFAFLDIFSGANPSGSFTDEGSAFSLAFSADAAGTLTSLSGTSFSIFILAGVAPMPKIPFVAVWTTSYVSMSLSSPSCAAAFSSAASILLPSK